MLKNLQTFLEYRFLDNSLKVYFVVFGIILCTGIIANILSPFIARRIKRILQNTGKKTLQEAVEATTRSLTMFLYVIAISFSTSILTVNTPIKILLKHIIHLASGVIIIYFIFRIVDILVAYLGEKAETTKTKLDDMLIPITGKTIKIFFVVITVLFILNNLGYNITSLVAGLGLGGLAVAMAAQDTLKNFFGAVAIFIDRPYTIGDRVIVEGVDGPIEQIGLRSTRIRTLDGTLVTIPNSRMADAIINNIQKRPTRKTMNTIGVTYDTSIEKMRRAIEIIRGIMKDHPGTENHLVYWKDYGPYSLNIFAIHWCKYLAYDKYLECLQEMNFQIKESFGKEGIEFAFPSQTLYLQNEKSSDKK